MKKMVCMLLSFAAALWAADGMEIGDVLQFAADGGLREVTVSAQSSPKVYIGSLDGYAGSLNATITVTDDGWTMDVDDWQTLRIWHVADTPGGMSVSVEAKSVNPQRNCRTKRVPSASASGARRTFSKVLTARDITLGWPADSVTNEIDVLVVYDASAISWLASHRRSAKGFAESQIAKMNAVLANSGLADDFRVTLRGVFAADFDVTRDCGNDKYEVLTVAVEQIVYGGWEQPWRAIRDERDRLGADVVMVIANSQPKAKTVDDIAGTVGISYGLEYDCLMGLYGWNKAAVNECRDSAYGACDIRVIETDNTFSHEVGHMLGAGHSDRLSPRYSVPGPQLFLYSSALMYRDSIDRRYYYTVMGYNSTDGGWFTPTYNEIPYYSSPDLRHPVTGSFLGDANHDNVRTMRETYAVVSQYRVRTGAASAEIDLKDCVVSEEWQRSRTLRGAAFSATLPSDEVLGIFEVKCGKASSKGVAKVSATFTGLDGKKTTYKAKNSVDVLGVDSVTVSLGDGVGAVELTISGNEFSGVSSLDGGFRVATAPVGGSLSAAAPKVYVPYCDFAPDDGGEVVAELLPTSGEPVSVKGGRWQFAKAASVKVVKEKGGDSYRLVIDESRDRTNRSGMKLTYTPKSGVFRGSFKICSLAGAANGRKKLKRHTASVTGVVVNGSGRGQAIVKRPASGPWSVTVE